jgi:PKD repeat protein
MDSPILQEAQEEGKPISSLPVGSRILWKTPEPLFPETVCIPMFRRLLALTFAALVATACDSGNPVAPDPPGSNNGSSSSVKVTVTSNKSPAEAGSAAAVTLSVSALQGSSPVADGTSATFSTSLGSFGSDSTGNPLQTTTVSLVGGNGSVSFFAGAKTGTANILTQVGTSVGQLNLPIVEPSPKPTASFESSVNELTALFTDTSTGSPTAWSWSFGDGGTSTQQNPMHTYDEPDTYTVTLVVSNSGGQSSNSQFVAVGEAPDLLAGFDSTANGLNVIFTDTSSGDPTKWSWDFGDGKSSTQQSPSHSYTRAGTYAVGLTVTNVYGTQASTSKFLTLSLGEAPKADFESAASGLRVLFTDKSTNSPTGWTWDFGDGSSSFLQNPSHTYAQAGTYNVALTVTNAAGTNTKTAFVTVSLGAAPEADFTVQTNGLSAVFQDKSKGSPTSWSWDFGECAGAACRSSAKNPSYTYQKAGTYTVTLTASNAAGSDQAVQLVTVTSSTKPTSDFCVQRSGLTVLFFDESTQSPTSWAWNFGDCAANAATCTATGQNPGHTYLSAGTYAVTLTTTNSAGSSTTSKFVPVDPGVTDAIPFCP